MLIYKLKCLLFRVFTYFFYSDINKKTTKLVLIGTKTWTDKQNTLFIESSLTETWISFISGDRTTKQP